MPRIVNEKENNKFNRINRILDILKQRAYSTQELAKLFGVTTKTITRDMQILEKNGVKKNGRVWEFDLNLVKDNLDNDEMIVINILDNISKNIGSDFYTKAHPLLKQLSMRLNEPIFVNTGSEKLDEKAIKNFEILENAIKNKCVISCDYGKYKYRAKPLKIALFEGFWYLLLFDCRGDKFKRFYLKDIKNIEILDEKFEISDKFEKRLSLANSIWFELENQFIARLLLSKNVVKFFKRKPYIKYDKMYQNADGSAEIEIEFSNIMEIKPLVYYFLPHIKVIEPKWLNDEILAEIAGYLGEIS